MDITQLAPRKAVKAEVKRGPFDPGGQPSLERDHPLHLSLFAWNVRSGLSATNGVLRDAARTADFWHWPSASRLLRLAESVGFDSQLQYGMWSGYGGGSGWNDAGLDFQTAGAASAAVTERLGLFQTIHVTYGFHPLLVAKLSSSVNHISGGRSGVNIVAGADPVDHRQFGIDRLRTPQERYAMADEFTTLLKLLWTSPDPVDFEGEYFTAYGAQVNPQPISGPRPLLINAASSDIGIDFASRQCDAIFITAPEQSPEAYAKVAKKVRDKAAEYERKVRVCAMCYVVMDETDEKAAETVAWLKDEVDYEALKNQFWRLKSVYHPDEGVAEDPYLGMGKEWFRGHGLGMGGHQLFGSYERVANELADLYESGVEQVALCFFDPHRGVKEFGDHVIPLLRKRGLRNDG